jgi:hypothetical protein
MKVRQSKLATLETRLARRLATKGKALARKLALATKPFNSEIQTRRAVRNLRTYLVLSKSLGLDTHRLREQEQQAQLLVTTVRFKKQLIFKHRYLGSTNLEEKHPPSLGSIHS